MGLSLRDLPLPVQTVPAAPIGDSEFIAFAGGISADGKWSDGLSVFRCTFSKSLNARRSSKRS
jgi:hypothetical protein